MQAEVWNLLAMAFSGQHGPGRLLAWARSGNGSRSDHWLKAYETGFMLLFLVSVSKGFLFHIGECISVLLGGTRNIYPTSDNASKIANAMFQHFPLHASTTPESKDVHCSYSLDLECTIHR